MNSLDVDQCALGQCFGPCYKRFGSYDCAPMIRPRTLSPSLLTSMNGGNTISVTVYTGTVPFNVSYGIIDGPYAVSFACNSPTSQLPYSMTPSPATNTSRTFQGISCLSSAGGGANLTLILSYCVNDASFNLICYTSRSNESLSYPLPTILSGSLRLEADPNTRGTSVTQETQDTSNILVSFDGTNFPNVNLQLLSVTMSNDQVTNLACVIIPSFSSTTTLTCQVDSKASGPSYIFILRSLTKWQLECHCFENAIERISNRWVFRASTVELVDFLFFSLHYMSVHFCDCFRKCYFVFIE